MERSPDQSSPIQSERHEYIHGLIKEFRDHLKTDKYEVPAETAGIVVLSAPFEKQGDEIIEKSQENIGRIEYAIDVIKDLVAKKLSKESDDVTNDDIIDHAPLLVLNGETEQLPMMDEVADELNFPKEKIRLVNAGDRGIGNTKTQFDAMGKDPEFSEAKHLTYITTSYHVPRVARTADKNLPPDADFDIIGVPLDRLDYNIYRKVRGEVKRIVTYSAKGDISTQPR